eukprot:CAMPEP_0174696324 /NCGR_PEP_ID=MMETSP1094-20130205/2494_1 /TAXON_ID=156173 /ORGANISM="Chrysochromulina brevifilum, Strain UTEX LB 985" /LENGTH=58 /DNA_ID=CAMNT_0015893059 /DNA_START=118 /DNA_END=294 /DNA_ORIENTATION=+
MENLLGGESTRRRRTRENRHSCRVGGATGLRVLIALAATGWDNSYMRHVVAHMYTLLT